MRISLALFLLCVVGVATAQKSIPITVANNVALVPLQVNGHKLNFLLDTGSERSALDVAIADQLRLPHLGETRVEKNYREQIAGTVEASTIENGTLHLGKQQFTVISLSPISRAIGASVDGVLGSDILASITFKINYSKRQIVVGELQRLGSLGTPIKLRRAGNQFFASTHILSLPTDLLVDTGTNSTSLSWTTWERVLRVWTPSLIIDGVVRAGTPVPPAFLVCIPSLQLGHALLTDQAVRVQRAVNSGVFSSNAFGGIIGSDLFRQFETTFDLKHDTIYLKHDGKYRPNPYRYVTVGIQFARNSQGTYSVMSVWKGSPADMAGIHLGDHITAVNGEPTTSMTPDQMSAKMHGVEGTPVNLILDRNGNLSAATLKTKPLLCNQQIHSDRLRAAQK